MVVKAFLLGESTQPGKVLIDTGSLLTMMLKNDGAGLQQKSKMIFIAHEDFLVKEAVISKGSRLNGEYGSCLPPLPPGGASQLSQVPPGTYLALHPASHFRLGSIVLFELSLCFIPIFMFVLVCPLQLY